MRLIQLIAGFVFKHEIERFFFSKHRHIPSSKHTYGNRQFGVLRATIMQVFCINMLKLCIISLYWDFFLKEEYIFCLKSYTHGLCQTYKFRAIYNYLIYTIEQFRVNHQTATDLSWQPPNQLSNIVTTELSLTTVPTYKLFKNYKHLSYQIYQSLARLYKILASIICKISVENFCVVLSFTLAKVLHFFNK